MHLFDLQLPFFLPVWRRVAVVIFCLAWAVIEFATAAPFWGIVFGGMGVFAFWQFFLDGWPPLDSESANDSSHNGSSGE